MEEKEKLLKTEEQIVAESETTNREVDEKIQRLKEQIAQNKLEKFVFKNSLYTDSQLAEYKAKKEKARRRAKLQKASRKANRK